MERERESTMEERTARRRERMVGNIAAGFEEAEQWDLLFWQRMTPQERLSALVAIRRDVAKVDTARKNARVETEER